MTNILIIEKQIMNLILIIFFTATAIFAQGTPSFNMTQIIPNSNGNDIALVDFNNDGHLDAFFANGIWDQSLPSKLWINDGKGHFTDSKQNIGNAKSWSVDASDVNGDGFTDVIIANGDWHKGDTSIVWLNDGQGIFSFFRNKFNNANSSCAALGDLNGDGSPDIYFANHPFSDGTGGEDEIWYNDGKGKYVISNQNLGDPHPARRIKLIDVNGDYLSDAIVLNGGGEKNEIWVNSGEGKFLLSKADIGTGENIDFAIGDVDNDEDNDIIIVKGAWGKTPKGMEVWLNDGKGDYSRSQSIGNYDGYGIALGDFNDDSFLDAVVVNGPNQPNQIFLNDGHGRYYNSESKIGEGGNKVAVEDINHDNNMDIIIVGNENTKVFLQ